MKLRKRTPSPTVWTIEPIHELAQPQPPPEAAEAAGAAAGAAVGTGVSVNCAASLILNTPANKKRNFNRNFKGTSKQLSKLSKEPSKELLKKNFEGEGKSDCYLSIRWIFFFVFLWGKNEKCHNILHWLSTAVKVVKAVKLSKVCQSPNWVTCKNEKSNNRISDCNQFIA